jgi:hypothetical protein
MGLFVYIDTAVSTQINVNNTNAVIWLTFHSCVTGRWRGVEVVQLEPVWIMTQDRTLLHEQIPEIKNKISDFSTSPTDFKNQFCCWFWY